MSQPTEPTPTPEPITPGLFSSEFLNAVIAKAVALLVTLGAVTITQADSIIQAATLVVAAVFAVGSAWADVAYNRGRVEVKKAALEVQKFAAVEAIAVTVEQKPGGVPAAVDQRTQL